MNSLKEFANQSGEQVQEDFFRETLVQRNGYYYFRTSGMDAPKSSLVLFQYNNLIIASAQLLDIEKFETPILEDYSGAYCFDLSTIEIFQPINLDEIQAIVPSIKRFSQAKQKIDIAYLSAIKNLITTKQISLIPEEISTKYVVKLMEGAKRQITVNAYERNYTARKLCLEHYGYSCSVCHFNFGHFYGMEFEGKIHVHHLKALSEINGQYLIDPVKDLRPVCPNCHLALHSKAGNSPYTIEELKKKIEKEKR